MKPHRLHAPRRPIAAEDQTLHHRVELDLGDAEQLPFPTMSFPARGRFKLFGLVTNRTLPGDELIRWQRERCGKSEEAHAVMKDDLAGRRLPIGLFGAVLDPPPSG